MPPLHDHITRSRSKSKDKRRDKGKIKSTKEEQEQGGETNEQSLIQTLQKSILRTTVYLSNNYNGTYLIPRTNPDPDSTVGLPILAVENPISSTLHKHVLLPLSTHPVLDRLYLPTHRYIQEREDESRDGRRMSGLTGFNNDGGSSSSSITTATTTSTNTTSNINNANSDQQETRKWVGMDLSFKHRYSTAQDFLDALDRSIEMLGANFIVDEPAQASVQRAFLMQIRGVFRDRQDVLASAQRHVDLLEQLVLGGYVLLDGEVFGSDVE